MNSAGHLKATNYVIIIHYYITNNALAINNFTIPF